MATETKLNINHNKRRNYPSMHNFIVVIVNGSYIIQLHKVAIVRSKHVAVTLPFTVATVKLCIGGLFFLPLRILEAERGYHTLKQF